MAEELSGAAKEVLVERYRYILSQIKATNDNVYRFLAIYQTLATAVVGAGIALFVNYRNWHISAGTARLGLTAAMLIVTVIAAFTVLLILIGVWTWLDYRNEECDVADKVVYPGFRSRPRIQNFFRWYESYIVLFIIATVLAMWILAEAVLIPAIQ